MFHVSIYANDVALRPCTDPLTSICKCTCIMDAQERTEARLSRKREREQRNHALESAEEREAWLARWRVRDRALRAAQSTAQREKATQKGAEFTHVCTSTHIYVCSAAYVRP